MMLVEFREKVWALERLNRYCVEEMCVKFHDGYYGCVKWVDWCNVLVGVGCLCVCLRMLFF
ncbi:MAG: hypothetical protein C5S49_07090 [Candidatus Methanogaster sp.]|nr:MAG: hypothetical protein C5S49_07090 [ANME-2 cluster archaeon]